MTSKEALTKNFNMADQVLGAYVGDLSDHHIFRLNRKPYLVLTCGRWEHYHMDSDTADKLNFDKMEAVAQYLTGLVSRISQYDLRGPFEGYDTTDTELAFLRKNLLPSLNRLGVNLKLDSREDILQLVWTMMSRFEI